MTGHYKDCGDEYAYERRLREKGYRRDDSLIFYWFPPGQCENPKGFIEPKDVKGRQATGWEWRKAIKNYIEKKTLLIDYKIVRGHGYWKDLGGDMVYEVWIKNAPIPPKPKGVGYP